MAAKMAKLCSDQHIFLFAVHSFHCIGPPLPPPPPPPGALMQLYNVINAKKRKGLIQRDNMPIMTYSFHIPFH